MEYGSWPGASGVIDQVPIGSAPGALARSPSAQISDETSR
jgi:hypothetical protein